MKLKETLKTRQDELAQQWTDLVHGTYPFGTVGFLRTQQNRFINPVGHQTKRAAEALFRNLLAPELDEADLTPALEEFMRVRSIQDFSAEAAVAVIFALKKLIRESAAPDLAADPVRLFPELLALEAEIDRIGIMAFGLYARNRDKIAQMRIEEIKRGQSQVLRRAERLLGPGAARNAGGPKAGEADEFDPDPSGHEAGE